MPTCTEYDYTTYQSDCINNTQSIGYNWKIPLLCEISNSTILPTNKTDKCEVCKSGQYLKTDLNSSVEYCDYCDDGW